MMSQKKNQLSLTFDSGGGAEAVLMHLRAYMHGFWQNSVFAKEKPEDTKAFFKCKFVGFMQVYYAPDFDMDEARLEKLKQQVIDEWRMP